MKFKNFRHLRKLPTGELIATVDVEHKKFLFITITRELPIFALYDGGHWYSMITGEIIKDNPKIHSLYTAHKIFQKL